MGLFSTIKETITFHKEMKQLRKDFEKKLLMYRTMTAEELATLPDDELCMAVSEKISALVENFGDEDEDMQRGLASLSEPQRVVYVLDYLEREVNNGGLCQFFVNSSRNTAPFVSESLGIVTAVMHKELFDDFIADNDIDVCDLTSFIIYDVDEFAAQCERYPFDAFDEKFYEYGTLEDALIPYIREHMDAF
ncbi:MAG: DUF4375 domain-containing protein [Lachnospiraceae bacterium]|nr:DUF4375 domain-containing protein [Lachnospiraceae bacterium]